jgi:hypothetical protein
MKKILWFTLCFLLLWVSSVKANDDNIQLDLPETNAIIEWVPEEIPRTVTFYIDADGDGSVDIKIAYSLIEAYPCKKNCVSRITDNGDHWLLPAPGINYYVVKKWIMYKIGNDRDWRYPYKTSEWMFKYQYNADWLEHKFYKLWPEQRMK